MKYSYLYFYGSFRDDTYIESLIKFRNMKEINSKFFKYLGLWISYTKFIMWDKEIENTVGVLLFNNARCYESNLKTRVMFLNCLVWSSQPYKYAAWRPARLERSNLSSPYHPFHLSHKEENHLYLNKKMFSTVTYLVIYRDLRQDKVANISILVLNDI